MENKQLTIKGDSEVKIYTGRKLCKEDIINIWITIGISFIIGLLLGLLINS